MPARTCRRCAPGRRHAPRVPHPPPPDRLRPLLELLRERGAVRASDLVPELGVSEVTVRRDLEALARRGLLERSHGGATLPGGAPAGVPGPARAAAQSATGRAARVPLPTPPRAPGGAPSPPSPCAGPSRTGPCWAWAGSLPTPGSPRRSP